MINPNTKVVPIDHGWANMKTEQDVFTSGVSEITTEPALFNDVLEFIIGFWPFLFCKKTGQKP